MQGWVPWQGDFVLGGKEVLSKVVNILDFVIHAVGAITSSSSMEMISPLVAKNPDTVTAFPSYSSVIARTLTMACEVSCHQVIHLCSAYHGLVLYHSPPDDATLAFSLSLE